MNGFDCLLSGVVVLVSVLLWVLGFWAFSRCHRHDEVRDKYKPNIRRVL